MEKFNLSADDQKLVDVLLSLSKTKLLEVSACLVSFTTSFEEIANKLDKEQPSSIATKDAIWEGLTRINTLRKLSTKPKGGIVLHGILGGAKEIEVDGKLNLIIHLDKYYLTQSN